MVATRRSSRISSAASSSLSAAKENPPATSKRTHVSDSESGLSPLSESEGDDSGEDSNVPLIVRNGKKPASGTGKKPVTKKVKLEVEISDKAPASTSSEDTETPGSFDMDQEADTPATTISSRASTVAPKWKGKGKAVEPPTINAVTRRLSGRLSKNIEEITDSQDELDEEDDSDDDLSYGEDMEDDETDDFESDIEAAVEIISAADSDNGLIAGSSIAAPLSLPPPPPPPIFRTARRTRVRQPARARAHTPWQSRSDRERAQLYYHHPDLKTIWDELGTRPKISVEKDPQPDGLSLTMLPFQREGLHWLRLQEQSSFRGGILADEMGMGKTIQTIALLMTQPRMKPNLVVAPTVALMQWRSEIEKYTNGALKVVIFHGANRESSAKELAKFDVVMTTYSVLESCYRKQHTGFKRKAGLFKEPSVLHSVDFHRVVLDEAHNIKDRSCNTAKAVFNLKTKFKLCLSGTPLQNRIGELFSLLRFLEADPFSYYYCRNCPCKSLHWKFSDNRSCDKCGHRPMSHVCFFNNDLLKPIQNHGSVGPGRTAFENLQKLLGHIMLRRTKLERADDLGLPPRVVKIRRDYFNEEELDLYDSIYGESKRKFNTYVSQGVVLNNYANIFTLITRMRQLADHPDLVLRKHSEEGQNTLVCALCDDEAEEAIKSRCHHTFCRLCVQKYIDGFAGWEEGKDEPDCPTCHITLNIDMTQPSIEGDYATIKKNSIINRINMSNWRSSTKIEALVEELYKLRSRTSTIKSIVFSQFTSMLQLVEWRLRRAGFSTVMLEGSMSPIQREATIKHFMNTTEVEVFLVSLKAGGVALNLIEASQVFIMDPWWNPSVEWQAADRIHRIGQNRVCNITRLVIEDSIESRIVDLQEKKARMIHATVGGDQKAMERLTPADMQFLFQN